MKLRRELRILVIYLAAMKTFLDEILADVRDRARRGKGATIPWRKFGA